MATHKNYPYGYISEIIKIAKNSEVQAIIELLEEIENEILNLRSITNVFVDDILEKISELETLIYLCHSKDIETIERGIGKQENFVRIFHIAKESNVSSIINILEEIKNNPSNIKELFFKLERYVSVFHYDQIGNK